jgi:hypothetical protein
VEHFEINPVPLMNPDHEARRAGLGRPETDQQVAAHRLRARGFSYRRIAETLRIGYGTVSHWLYAEAPAPGVKAQPPPLVDSLVLPAVPSPAKPNAPAQGTTVLEIRVAMLEAGLARVQKASAQREAELIAELDSLRGALAAASGAGGSLVRLLRWSRGRETA